MADGGLSLSDIISVTIALTAQAATTRNFGNLLILGDSNVIDVQQRLRLYGSLEEIGADYGEDAPEYQAAEVFFAPTPTPAQCYVGRWASTPTSGILVGGALSAAQQAIANFTAITAGAFQIAIDGATATAVTGLNFSAQTNLNGVASVITTALAGAATVTWNAVYGFFQVTSATTGTTSSVSFATSPASGTDVSGLLGLTAASSGSYTVAGVAAETIESAVSTLAGMSNDWYGLQIAATAEIADADYVGVATIIEGLSTSRIFGVTTQEAAALNPQSTTDLAAMLQTGDFMRTFAQYSSTNAYASAGIFGSQFTTDFSGVNTMKTVKFQTEPGVVAETLTEAQAAALRAKNCNVYVNYASGNNTDIAIVQEGTMANGYFFDEVYGTDWLANLVQVNAFNALATAGTKVPLTDAGANVVETQVASSLTQANTNGLIAVGVWNGSPLGSISTGQTLPLGFYIYVPPVSTMTTAQQQSRTLPTLQAIIILAGAVHFAGVLITAQR